MKSALEQLAVILCTNIHMESNTVISERSAHILHRSVEIMLYGLGHRVLSKHSIIGSFNLSACNVWVMD